jgi:aminopeptidase N
MLSRVTGLIAVLWLSVVPDALRQAAIAGAAMDVRQYVARIEPEIASKSIRGTVAITISVDPGGERTVVFDSGDLVVDSASEDGRPLVVTRLDRQVAIGLPSRPAASRRIELAYHGLPRSGLQFHPERNQVYTSFSTGQWLPSVSAPAERATLDLTVVLPAGLASIGSGRLQRSRPLSNGTVEHHWQQDRPVPAYTFGFAAGPFVDVSENRGTTRLRYLGSGFAETELRRIFRESRDMMAFFEEKAGRPYPDDTYTQALVASTAGQEMSGFSIMSEEYGRAVLADERALSLIAHEMAHQWWGNEVTCREWTHFWLNEGFATFMAAAYAERRFGREEYLRIIDASRGRYERVREAGRDRALVFPDWNRPTADDRTLVYHKGAYVLHLLRDTLGDGAFWEGVRAYTRTHFGAPVTSSDFQRAMEQSTGRSLAPFFATWVYAAGR